MTEQETLPCAAGKDTHPSVDQTGRGWSLRFCARHLDRVSKILRDIEAEFGDLNAAPSISVAWNTAGGGNSGGSTPAFERAPVRLDAVVARDPRRGDTSRSAWSWNDGLAKDKTPSALHDLHYWANRVRAFRRIQVTPTPNLHADRDLLSRQLDRIAEQDWAGDFYKAMTELLSQLQGVNGTKPESPLPGKCPVESKPEVECGGPLWPAKPKHSVGEWTGHAPSVIECSACRTRWQGGQQIAVLWMSIEASKRRKAEAE